MEHFYRENKVRAGWNISTKKVKRVWVRVWNNSIPKKGGGGDAGGTVEHFLIQQIKSKIVRKQNKSWTFLFQNLYLFKMPYM